MLNQDESNLRCIIYLSSATNLMTDAEIEALLVSARNSNAAQNITGVLMYLDGNFVQYIEGPEDNLLKTYNHISSSPKHKDIIKIMDKSIAVRNFPDWLMGSTMITKSELFKLKALDVKERFNNETVIAQFLKTIIDVERSNLHFS